MEVLHCIMQGFQWGGGEHGYFCAQTNVQEFVHLGGNSHAPLETEAFDIDFHCADCRFSFTGKTGLLEGDLKQLTTV